MQVFFKYLYQVLLFVFIINSNILMDICYAVLNKQISQLV